MTEILLAGIARSILYHINSIRYKRQLERLELIILSSMRVSNRTIPPTELWEVRRRACGGGVRSERTLIQAGLQSPKGGEFRSKLKLKNYRTDRNQNMHTNTSPGAGRQRVKHGFWALGTEAASKLEYRTMSKPNGSNRVLPCYF